MNGVEIHWSASTATSQPSKLEAESDAGTSDASFPRVDVVTCTLSNLPAHTMVRVGVDIDSDGDVENGESATVSFANRDITLDRIDYNDTNQYIADDGTGNNRWTEHSGSSLSITIDATNLQQLYVQRLTVVHVALYQPTITVGGGGTGDERDGTPIDFSVSRHTPGGFQGTSC